MTQKVSHPSAVNMEFIMEKIVVRPFFLQVLQHSIPVSSLQSVQSTFCHYILIQLLIISLITLSNCGNYII